MKKSPSSIQHWAFGVRRSAFAALLLLLLLARPAFAQTVAIDRNGNVQNATVKFDGTVHTLFVDGVEISGAAMTDARTPLAHAASHASAGSDPVTLAMTQITGLVAALAGKSDTGHTHAFVDLTGKPTTISGYGLTTDLHAVGDARWALIAHTHTGSDISGIDVSDDTNLAGTANEITLTGDTLSAHSALTRDTEWDTAAKINAATTDNDFALTTHDHTGVYQPLDSDLTAIADLADPNADRLLFWDDSVGAWTHLTLGANLSITDTTINAAAGTPGGSDTQLQYNNAGAFGGVSGLTWDGTTVTTSANAVNSFTSLASTPALRFTGSWFTGGTGTTTFPHLLLQATGTTASTTWSTAGTGIGVNAVTGFTGNLIDLQLAGVSSFRVTSAGNAVFGGSITIPAGALLAVSGRSLFSSPSNGQWTLFNNASSGFTRLNFGGTSSSFAAIGFDTVNGFTLQSAAGTATWNDASTAASGTVANRYLFGIAAPTLSSTNTNVTDTIASTWYIGGAPTAGTNTTIGTAYALYVATGNTNFGTGLATFSNLSIVSSSANSLNLNRTQTANDTGAVFTFYGGAAGADERGLIGFTHTGTGLDTIFTGESADSLGIRAQNDLILGGGGLTKMGLTLDGSTTGNDTRLLLWDVTAGTFRRVTIGAADSGGAGFRVLRIPN